MTYEASLHMVVTEGTPARRCGECTLCCKLLPVFDGVTVNGKRLPGTIDKPAGQRCKYQRHSKGCAVYRTKAMPHCCSLWNCRWLVGDDTADLSRPDRSHLVIDVMPDFISVRDNATGELQHMQAVQVWCDPHYPDAHRTPQFRRYVERRAADNQVVVVRFNSRDSLVVIPPCLSSDGQWHEQVTELADQQTRLRMLLDPDHQLAEHLTK